MKILVTGSEGLIGRALVSELSSLGHIVVGVDKATDPTHDFTDLEFMTELLDEAKPDTVIHLAALKDMVEAQENSELYNQVNVVGSKALIDLCIDKGIKRFIFASSAAVNDGENEYATNKREVESYLGTKQNKLMSAILRFESIIDDSGLVYKPTSHSLIDNLIGAIREGRAFIQYGNPIRGFMALSYALQLITQLLSINWIGVQTVLPIKSIYVDVTGFIKIFNSLLPQGTDHVVPQIGTQREWEVNTIRANSNVNKLRGLIWTILNAPHDVGGSK